MKDLKDLTTDVLAEMTVTMTDKEIGEIFGVSSRAIQKRRARAGIKPGSRRRFEPDPKELKSLYAKMPAKKVAEHYGVGETVVWKRLEEHGLIDRSQPEWGHHRKKGFNFAPKHLENLQKAARMRRGVYVGPKNPNWRGGKSGTHGRGRAAHTEWKAAVLERAGHQCERCGVKNGFECECCSQVVRLHAHHIKSYAQYTELRYDIDNGEALCPSCHHKEHYSKTG